MDLYQEFARRKPLARVVALPFPSVILTDSKTDWSAKILFRHILLLASDLSQPSVKKAYRRADRSAITSAAAEIPL